MSSDQVRDQEKTTKRLNTLFDDADDIQPQLDNEARDKYMFAKVNQNLT